MVGGNSNTKDNDTKMAQNTPEKKDTKSNVDIKLEEKMEDKSKNDTMQYHEQGHRDRERGGDRGRGMGRDGMSRGGMDRGGSNRGGMNRGAANFGNRGGNRGGGRPYNTNRGGNRGSWNNNPRYRDNRNYDTTQTAQEQEQERSFTQDQNREVDESIWDQNPMMVKEEPPAEVVTQVQTPKEVKKFTQRCRLFVGNITADTTEEEFRQMFATFGETDELFMNAHKGFAFIRLDYRANAEAAKAALDGFVKKGRTLRVRFASQAAALKVKNLASVVSNEMLADAFSQFGEIEKAVVIVDDRGRPTGEGIVEYARKQSASIAFKRITEGVFILTTSPRPLHVEMLIQNDEDDGYPERFVPRNETFRKEREIEPRFAPPGSFEYNFCQRWKRLFEVEKKQQEQLKILLEEERLKLEGEMENAIMEQHEEMLKQDLLRQQEELRRLQEIRQQNEQRRRQEIEMRVQGMRANAFGAFSGGDERRVGGRDEQRDGRGNARDDRGGPDMMRGVKEEYRHGGAGGGIGGMGMEAMPTMAVGDMPSNMMGSSQPMQPPPAPPAALQLEMERARAQGMEGGGADLPKLMSNSPSVPPQNLMSGAMGYDGAPASFSGFNNGGQRSDDAGKSMFGRQGGVRDHRGERDVNARRREGITQRDMLIDMKRARRF